MILPVYLYNHPILKKKAQKVTEMTDDLREFIKNMQDTMHGADGIGLAANQVGSDKAITVVDISDVDEERGKQEAPMVLINPVIEFFSDEEEELQEGCLSLPEFREYVTRPSQIQVRYLDANMKEQVKEADELLARVIQHEVDHLNGIYFFERLSPLKRALSQKKLKRILRGEIDPNYPTLGLE
ncbi:MAG: peptide deformylase [Bacteroidota bacterium]